MSEEFVSVVKYLLVKGLEMLEMFFYMNLKTDLKSANPLGNFR